MSGESKPKPSSKVEGPSTIYNQHMDVKHSNMGKPEISGILDESKDNIKKIEITCTERETCKMDGMEIIKCSVCAATYNDMTAYTHHLNVHLKREEEQSQKKQFQTHKCQTCDKIFLDKTSLENHVKTHVGNNVIISVIQQNPLNILNSQSPLKSILKNEGVQPKVNRDVKPIMGQGVQSILKSQRLLKSTLKNEGVQPTVNQGVKPIVGNGVHPVVGQEIRPIVNSQGVQPPLNQEFQPIVGQGVQSIVGQGVQSTNGTVALFKCYLCSKQFISKEFVSKHILNKHIHIQKQSPNQQTEKRSISCTIYGMSFSEKKDLNFHISDSHMKDVTHNNPDPSIIADQEDNANISKESSFQQDFNDKSLGVKSKENEAKWKLFACTRCDRSFANKEALTCHFDTVHRHVALVDEGLKDLKELENELKPFTCSLCDKSFTAKKALTNHFAAVHTKSKPFSCTLCDKSFSERGHLTGHVKSEHLKLKPFSCTLCEKSFSQNVILTTHIEVVHQKVEKRYLLSCTICDKSFAQPGDLTQHVYSVHRPFSCALCKTSFLYKANLDLHVKMFHKKEGLTTHKSESSPGTVRDKSFSSIHNLDPNIGSIN